MSTLPPQPAQERTLRNVAFVRGTDMPVLQGGKIGSSMFAGPGSASADCIPQLIVERSQQAVLLNLKAKAKRSAVRRKRFAALNDALRSSETVGADIAGSHSRDDLAKEIIE